MTKISNDNKIIAKKLAESFGGKPSIREYIHNSLPLKVDIISSENQPENGVNSFGTIGISDHPLKWGSGEFETRIEICGAIESSVDLFPNILSSAAFNIMRSKVVCFPGSCMENYVKEYYPNTNLPHLYFTSPYIWENLKSTTLEKKTVTWLLCFPIAQKEMDYLSRRGDAEFESLLETKGVNIFNFKRESAV